MTSIPLVYYDVYMWQYIIVYIHGLYIYIMLHQWHCIMFGYTIYHWLFYYFTSFVSLFMIVWYVSYKIFIVCYYIIFHVLYIWYHVELYDRTTYDVTLLHDYDLTINDIIWYYPIWFFTVLNVYIHWILLFKFVLLLLCFRLVPDIILCDIILWYIVLDALSHYLW